MTGVAFAAIGWVTGDARLVIHGVAGGKVVDLPAGELKESWQRPLRW